MNNKNILAKNLRYAEDITDDDRLFAMLAYASQLFFPIIMPIFILVSEQHKTRHFQRYHALHALGFILVVIVLGVICLMLTAVTLGCLAPIFVVWFFLYIVLLLYYAYLAHQGYYFEIPFITDMVRSYLGG